MTTVVQIRKKCVGCGICQDLQPAVWRMSKKDGKATLLKAEVKKNVHIARYPGAEDISRVVAEVCPGQAIKVNCR